MEITFKKTAGTPEMSGVETERGVQIVHVLCQHGTGAVSREVIFDAPADLRITALQFVKIFFDSFPAHEIFVAAGKVLVPHISGDNGKLFAENGGHTFGIGFAVSESLHHKVAHVKAVKTAPGDAQFLKKSDIVLNFLPDGGNVFGGKIPVVFFKKRRMAAQRDLVFVEEINGFLILVIVELNPEFYTEFTGFGSERVKKFFSFRDMKVDG
jgi:hypothetical protein